MKKIYTLIYFDVKNSCSCEVNLSSKLRCKEYIVQNMLEQFPAKIIYEYEVIGLKKANQKTFKWGKNL